MVSAVEVAAVQHKAWSSTPEEILRDSKPELAARLERAGNNLFSEVASALSRELRATTRFLDFMVQFCPPPPAERPSPAFQLDWAAAAMRRRLNAIYRYRSEALHEGIPFPPPMCGPPHRAERNQPHIECFHGLAAAQLGGVWTKDDVPMSL